MKGGKSMGKTSENYNDPYADNSYTPPPDNSYTPPPIESKNPVMVFGIILIFITVFAAIIVMIITVKELGIMPSLYVLTSGALICGAFLSFGILIDRQNEIIKQLKKTNNLLKD